MKNTTVAARVPVEFFAVFVTAPPFLEFPLPFRGGIISVL
jgi:hypothetical protein